MADDDTRSEVDLPFWLKVALERFATERTFRWRGHYASEGDNAREAYEDMMDEFREQFEVLEGGSGRIVVEITEYADSRERMVAKVVGGRSKGKSDQIPVSSGFLQNWREILLSRYPPVEDIIQPVVASSQTGLWLVMPYAEQYGIEWSHDRIDQKAECIENHHAVEPVMRGNLGGGLDIYWTENWGAYQGEYRLVDYGGVVLHDEPELRPGEYPFRDPAWDNTNGECT